MEPGICTCCFHKRWPVLSIAAPDLPREPAHENKLMLRIIFALLTLALVPLCFNHLWRLDWS